MNDVSKGTSTSSSAIKQSSMKKLISVNKMTPDQKKSEHKVSSKTFKQHKSKKNISSESSQEKDKKSKKRNQNEAS
ncbi:MAG: hypothetical protein Q8P90_02505 [bacterium]|nr:hypothetical protein [bacterium]